MSNQIKASEEKDSVGSGRIEVSCADQLLVVKHPNEKIKKKKGVLLSFHVPGKNI